MRAEWGEPCSANRWNWGGRCPETHRYRNVGGIGMPYMRDTSYSALTAAFITAWYGIDHVSPDGSRFDYESAIYWADKALRDGIVFT